MGFGVLGSLPSWLDVQFAQTATAVLAVAALVILVVVIFLVRSIGTRIVIVVLMGAAVVGLLHYRQTLKHCDKNGCECKFLGEDLKGGGCASTPAAQSR